MNDTVFYAQFDRGSHTSGLTDYAHFSAKAMVWGKESYAGQDHTGMFAPNSYSIDVPQNVRALAGLEISAQIDERPGEFYGWRISYDRDRIELRDAEDMVKVLRKIDKAMTKIADQYGRPVDIASYANHAAIPVAGHGRVFWRSLRPDEPDYDGTGYRAMDTDGLRWWLEDEVSKWRKDRGHVGTD